MTQLFTFGYHEVLISLRVEVERRDLEERIKALIFFQKLECKAAIFLKHYFISLVFICLSSHHLYYGLLAYCNQCLNNNFPQCKTFFLIFESMWVNNTVIISVWKIIVSLLTHGIRWEENNGLGSGGEVDSKSLLPSAITLIRRSFSFFPCPSFFSFFFSPLLFLSALLSLSSLFSTYVK